MALFSSTLSRGFLALRKVSPCNDFPDLFPLSTFPRFPCDGLPDLSQASIQVSPFQEAPPQWPNFILKAPPPLTLSPPPFSMDALSLLSQHAHVLMASLAPRNTSFRAARVSGCCAHSCAHLLARSSHSGRNCQMTEQLLSFDLNFLLLTFSPFTNIFHIS